MRANALGHHHDERAIIHIKPVGTTDEFIGAVPYKWTVYVLAQVWLVESSHRALNHILSAPVVASIDEIA
jgi:hypothetical protein